MFCRWAAPALGGARLGRAANARRTPFPSPAPVSRTAWFPISSFFQAHFRAVFDPLFLEYQFSH